jgi:hypothetical protein
MLEWQRKIDIADGASLAVAKLAGDPEAVSYLAEALSYYLPSADRAQLLANIAAIETNTWH